MFYKFKIKVTKPNEKTGTEREVTEEYLTDDILYGQVELKALQIYPDRDADCITISRSNIKEIVNDELPDSQWYDATVSELFVLESGREKKMKYHLLVSATSVDDATERVNRHLRQGFGDMSLEAVKLTRIVSII